MLRFLKNLIFAQFCWKKSSKISHLIDVVKVLGIIEGIEKLPINQRNKVRKFGKIYTLVFEKKHSITILENKVKLYNSILTKYYEYQKKVSRRIMLKLKLLYFQIDNDVQFESFNYSSRQSITPEVDAKLKSVIKIRDFENIILDEFVSPCVYMILDPQQELPQKSVTIGQYSINYGKTMRDLTVSSIILVVIYFLFSSK